MENGWSIKNLHRLIMNSAVYQQSALNNPAYGKIDPNNALLYKWNLRRLDFEAMRDTMLVLGDNLTLPKAADPPTLLPRAVLYTGLSTVHRCRMSIRFSTLPIRT